MKRVKKKNNFLGSLKKNINKLFKATRETGLFRRNVKTVPQLITSIGRTIPMTPDSGVIVENYSKNAYYYLSDPLLCGVVDLRSTLIHMAGYDIICTNGENDEVLVEEIKLFLERVEWNSNQDRTSVHLDIYGNDIYYIVRDEEGTPVQLIPIPIEKIDILIDENNNEPYLFKFNKPLSSYKGSMQYEILQAEPKDILFFRGKRVGESAYGYSKIYTLKGVLEARSTIFQLMPEIIRSQVFPWMHITLDEDRLGADYESVKERLENVFDEAKNEQQTQYLITPSTVTMNTFALGTSGKGQAQSVDTMLTQLDRQIFAVFGMNESILYAKGTTDLLRKQGNELFVRNVMARAREMEEGINKLIDDYLLINCPERIGDFKIKYREITRDDDNSAYNRIIDMMNKNLITKMQALEMVKSTINMEIPEVEESEEEKKESTGNTTPRGEKGWQEKEVKQ